jgi:5-methylcytosine-specific restriction endonuclease McrA
MSISVFKKGIIPWNKNKPNEKVRGDKHYNWKGGVSKRRELNNVEWNILKHQCYSRDNWTCFKCGKHIHKKGEIQAHHLIPKRLGGKDLLGYLITLCQSCHIKIEKSIWERLTRKENCSAVFN